MKSRILVIDDDELYREGICMQLDLEGYEVIAASSGKKGFELAKDKLPDLVLTEVNMLEMNGYDTLRLLRSEKRTSSIPIIMMTGRTTHDLQFRYGGDMYPDDYIIIPFTRLELLTSITAKLPKDKERLET